MESEESDFDDERWDEPAEISEKDTPGLGQSSSHQMARSQAELTSNVGAASTSGTSVSLMALNDNKAGMAGLDKEKISKIIEEASKGSRFYENERKKEAQVNQRIKRMMSEMACITLQQKAAALEEVDVMVAVLEADRRFDRSIVHLDMDAFYAAVEMRDNPALKDKPMAVGGMSMLSTSNYHARRFGVRAAMPGFIGKKLCPGLVIVPTNFDKYRAVSAQVRQILAEYDPNFCPMSLDEAYFDLTDHLVVRRSMSKAQRTFPYGEWNEAGNESKEDAMSSRSEMEGSDEGSEPVESQSVNQLATQACENPNVKRTMRGVTEDDASSGERNGRERSPETSCLLQSSCRLSEGEDLFRDSKAAVSKRTRSRTFGFTVEDAVEEIRFRIEQRTQLTASAGIAPNVMLAKICSDKNKPNGQYRIQPNREAVMAFIQELPIRKVSGIGKVTEKLLAALGIQTCTHLYQQRALLKLLFSPISFQHFLRISLGLGSTTVERDGERKSMSTERTFGELSRPVDLYNKCNQLCLALAEDLQKEDVMGKTVTLKIKTVKFEVKTRASSVPSCINSADAMFRVAKDLLRTEINACKPEPLRLRLMGVRLSNLLPCGSGEGRQDSIKKFFKRQAHTSGHNAVSDEQQHTTSSPTLLGSVNTTQARFTEATPSTDCATELNADLPQASLSSGSAGQSCNSLPDLGPGDGISQSLETSANVCEPGSLFSDEVPASQSMVCPVCNVQQPGVDLKTINEHVDVCLNREPIRNMLKQQSSERLSNLHESASSPGKRQRSLSGSEPASKRRKQERAVTNTLHMYM